MQPFGGPQKRGSNCLIRFDKKVGNWIDAVDCYMDACMGIAVIRRTGKVLAAEWHGKLTTFLLYTLMIAHVVFYNIAPALSDTLIIICTAMMCFSFLMYMMRNIRALKSVGKKTEKKPERTVQAFER